MQYKTHLKWSLFILITWLTACNLSQGPSSPMMLSVSVEPEPVVGKVAVLHIEVISDGRAMPHTTLAVTLPSGVEAVNDDLMWSGNIAVGETANIDISIRVTSEGEWPIEVYAYSSTSPDPNSGGFGAFKTVYIQSSVISAIVIEDTARTPTPVPLHSSGEGTLP